jgi:hypothetical protein
VQSCRHKKISGDITLANIFFERGGDRIVMVGLHYYWRGLWAGNASPTRASFQIGV